MPVLLVKNFSRLFTLFCGYWGVICQAHTESSQSFVDVQGSGQRRLLGVTTIHHAIMCRETFSCAPHLATQPTALEETPHTQSPAIPSSAEQCTAAQQQQLSSSRRLWGHRHTCTILNTVRGKKKEKKKKHYPRALYYSRGKPAGITTSSPEALLELQGTCQHAEDTSPVAQDIKRQILHRAWLLQTSYKP